MDAIKVMEIQYIVRGRLTDAICLAGANVSTMKHFVNRKYVSKKELRAALEFQMQYLIRIERAKDDILAKTL